MSFVIFYGESEGETIGYTDYSPEFLVGDTRFFTDTFQERDHIRVEAIRKTRLTHINTIRWHCDNEESDPFLYGSIKEKGIKDTTFVYRNYELAPCSYLAINNYVLLNTVEKLHEDGFETLVPIKILRKDINENVLSYIINGLDNLDPLDVSDIVYKVLSIGRKKPNGRLGFLPERYVGELFGISQSMVCRHKHISSNMSPAVRLAYNKGDISYSKMRAIAMADLEDQLYFLEKADRLEYHELEARIARKKISGPMARHKPLKGKVRSKYEITDMLNDMDIETEQEKIETLEWVLSLRDYL